MSVKKQFIAGAVCPRCGEMDKIVMYKQDGKDFRECVSCGFEDEMHFKPQQRELNTRVNQIEGAPESEVQAVKILPNKE